MAWLLDEEEGGMEEGLRAGTTWWLVHWLDNMLLACCLSRWKLSQPNSLSPKFWYLPMFCTSWLTQQCHVVRKRTFGHAVDGTPITTPPPIRHAMYAKLLYSTRKLKRAQMQHGILMCLWVTSQLANDYLILSIFTWTRLSCDYCESPFALLSYSKESTIMYE